MSGMISVVISYLTICFPCPPSLQVTLLASGRLMYFGPCEGLDTWFTEGLGYYYSPELHGNVSDWVLDMVAIGFKKPTTLYGSSMTCMEHVQDAAAEFNARYLQQIAAEEHQNAIAAVDRSNNHSVAINVFSNPLTTTAVTASIVGVNPQGLELATVGKASHSTESRKGVRSSIEAAEFVSACSTAPSEFSPEYQSMASSVGSAPAAVVPSQPSSLASQTSWWRQFKWLLWRELKIVTRNPADVCFRTLTYAWLAIFTSLQSFNLADNAYTIRIKFYMLFFIAVPYLLLPYVVMSLYTADRRFYLADVSAKLYRPSAYYAAKVRCSLQQVSCWLVMLFLYFASSSFHPIMLSAIP